MKSFKFLHLYLLIENLGKAQHFSSIIQTTKWMSGSVEQNHELPHEQQFLLFLSFSPFLRKKLSPLWCLQFAFTDDFYEYYFVPIFVPSLVVSSTKELLILLVEKELVARYSSLLSIKAARVKKDCSMASPETAQVQMQQTPFSVHHLWISSIGTELPKSFLLPRRRQLALGARLKASSYHTFFTFSQLAGFDTSKIRITPWHDLKYVATMERNFYWPAVSHMHSFTFLS